MHPNIPSCNHLSSQYRTTFPNDPFLRKSEEHHHRPQTPRLLLLSLPVLFAYTERSEIHGVRAVTRSEKFSPKCERGVARRGSGSNVWRMSGTRQKAAGAITADWMEVETRLARRCFTRDTYNKPALHIRICGAHARHTILIPAEKKTHRPPSNRAHSVQKFFPNRIVFFPPLLFEISQRGNRTSLATASIHQTPLSSFRKLQRKGVYAFIRVYRVSVSLSEMQVELYYIGEEFSRFSYLFVSSFINFLINKDLYVNFIRVIFQIL